MNNERINKAKLKNRRAMEAKGKAIALISAGLVVGLGTGLVANTREGIKEEKQTTLDYFRARNQEYREVVENEDLKTAKAFINGEVAYQEFDEHLHDLHSDELAEAMFDVFAGKEEKEKMQDLDVKDKVAAGLVGAGLVSSTVLASAGACYIGIDLYEKNKELRRKDDDYTM